MKKAETYKSPFIDALLKDISSEESVKIEKRMLLAARIDEAIKANGWKQKDLAKALKKSPSEISKWLSGTHNFTCDTLIDLEQILDIRLINVESGSERVIGTYKCKVTLQTQGIEYLQNTFFQTATKPTFKAKARIHNC